MSSEHLVGLLEILQSATIEVCQGCKKLAIEHDAVCDNCYAFLCGNLPCALDPEEGMEEWAHSELAFVCAPCFVRYREDKFRRIAEDNPIWARGIKLTGDSLTTSGPWGTPPTNGFRVGAKQEDKGGTDLVSS